MISKKKKRKKKVFAGIRRLFLAEIRNLNNGFSSQKQVISKQKKKGLRRNPKAFSGPNQKLKRFFRPKTATFSSQKPALKSRWGTPKSRIGEGDAHLKKKKYSGRARNKWGGGDKHKNRGGGGGNAPPLATHLASCNILRVNNNPLEDFP